MITLALDTTTAAGSLAVGRGPEVLVARRGDPSRPHGERLPGDIVSVLDEAGVALAEVTLFAVARGPGAFTGLRIGIAAIQGLAFASGRPVVGISALEALAEGLAGTVEPGTALAIWMDAARQEVFASAYDVAAEHTTGTPLPVLHPPSVGAAGAVLAAWGATIGARGTVFLGDGAVRYRSAIEHAHPDARILEAWPLVAASMIPLAFHAAARGEAGPPHAIRPLYVRRPDAEIARDQRVARSARDAS